MSNSLQQPKHEEKVKGYLTSERLDLIYNAISQGLNDYRVKYKDESHIHKARTKANLINDHIVNHVEVAFSDDKNAHIYSENGSLRLSFFDTKGAVVLRFKKMDQKMRVHNIPTQQALAFNEQTTLFGSSININAGYLPVGLDYKIIVACPENSAKNYWVWEVEQPTSKDVGMGEVVTLPVSTPPTTPQTTTKRHAVPRREILKENEDVK